VRQLSERSTGLPEPSQEGNSVGAIHPRHVDVKLAEHLTSRTAAITWQRLSLRLNKRGSHTSSGERKMRDDWQNASMQITGLSNSLTSSTFS